jgi:regulatory protein
MRQFPPTPRPPPDANELNTSALAHLARFAATEAGLKRILVRKIDRWARTAEGDPDAILAACASLRAAIPAIIARLVATGAISDAAFAESRARSLARAGRSRRAIGAHLASRGVPEPLAATALPQSADHELAAALIHARKRRIGPWSKAEISETEAAPAKRRRELAGFARAGFAQFVALRALRTPLDEAEALIATFRAAL